MAKTQVTQPEPSKRTATKAFERAWKLLGQLEKRLAAARAEESKRRRQLLDASGDEIARRQDQLDAAVASLGKAAALLTELSDMIAANARAKSRQTVSDVAHEAAQAVRDEARARTATQAATGLNQASQRTIRAGTNAPATPRASRVNPRPALPQPPASPSTAARPVARRTRISAPPTPATRTPTTGRSATPAKPRSRRSLQPGDGDPGQSSS